MRLLAALVWTLLLPSIAAAQVTPDTLDLQASRVQGAVHGAQTYSGRVRAANTRGDSAQVRRELNQLDGRLQATETTVVRLRGLVVQFGIDTLDPPADTLPPIVVVPPEPVDSVKPPVVVPPVPAEVWADTLLGHYAGDVIVPDGERWLIGPGVTIAGNLRTDGGLIGMRPGSSLRFIGANPLEYVGGGMTYSDAMARDIGLWVGGTGILDVSCTPKVGSNREGRSSSWLATDELWITPTAPGDLAPRRFTPSDSVPQFDPRVPAAEIVNVTRDCLIEGPGHIHISSSVKSRIEYVTLRGMGIVNPVCGTVCGRYALHLHMMGEGSRDMVIRGVAAIDSKGTVFVPHTSNGVTYLDNVSVNSYGEGFWWDKGSRTNDLLVDGLVVTGVDATRELLGQAPRASAIVLGRGENLTIRNASASGVRVGGSYGAGFEWFPANNRNEEVTWAFGPGNVAHNLTGPGIRFWNNSGQQHLVNNTQVYNTGFGILNGAYSNANRYEDFLSLNGGIFLNSSCKVHQDDGLTGWYKRVEVHADDGAAVTVQGQNLETECRTLFEDCKLYPAPGFPVVQVNKTENPWEVLFRNCGVTPSDFNFAADAIDGTSIWIEQDGKRTEVRRQNGRTIVSN